MSRFRPMLATSVLCALIFSQPMLARADVLTESIPADAKAVVIANDLTKAEASIRAFIQSAQIPAPLPPGPLTEQATAMGLGDLKKGLAVVVTDPNPQGIAVLLPVDDPQATLKQLGAMAQGDVYTLSLPNMPLPLSALAKEKLLVIAASADALAAFRSPAKNLEGKLSAAQKKLRGDSNLFFYVNVPAWRPIINPGLDQVEQMLGAFQGGFPGGAAAVMDPEAIFRMLKMYLDGARSFVNQTDALHGGVAISGQNAQLKIGATFESGSYLHKTASSAKRSQLNLLADLPSMPFYIAFGADTSSLGSFFTDMMKVMMDAAGDKIDAKKKKEAVDAFAKYWSKVKGFNTVFDIGAKGMQMAAYYFVDDPKEAMKLTREMTEASKEMMKIFMPVGGGSFEVTSKKSAGIDVDEYLFSFEGLPEQARQAIEMMYGGDLRWQMGVVGGKLGYAMAPGLDEPITLLTKKKSNLADEKRIKAILGDLPRGSVAIGLFDPFGLISMMKAMAGRFGAPAGAFAMLQVPEQLPPPVGMALTAESDGFTVHLVVRADLVSELVKLAPN